MFDRDPDRYQAGGTSDPRASRWGGAVPTTPEGARVGAREGFLTMSFVWMFVALLVSAGAAWFVIANESALRFVVQNFMLLLIAELVFVFAISLGINRIGAYPALALLFA